MRQARPRPYGHVTDVHGCKWQLLDLEEIYHSLSRTATIRPDVAFTHTTLKLYHLVSSAEYLSYVHSTLLLWYNFKNSRFRLQL